MKPELDVQVHQTYMKPELDVQVHQMYMKPELDVPRKRKKNEKHIISWTYQWCCFKEWGGEIQYNFVVQFEFPLSWWKGHVDSILSQ